MGNSTRPKLSIIIVSFNTVDLTVSCLKSILTEASEPESFQKNIELIIVDNASTDDSVKSVKSLLQNQSFINNWQVLENKSNVGFTKANNQAIKIAHGEYILLLNSDTTVQPSAIENLLKFAQESDNSLGLIALSLLNPDGSYQPQGGSFPSLLTLATQQFLLDDLPLIGQHLPSLQYRYRKVGDLQPSHWVSGTALLIKQSVINKIGLLDETIFMYGEDIDYCYRAQQAGFQSVIYHPSQISHLGSGSGSSARAIEGEVKGVLGFFKKYRPAWQLPMVKVIIWLGSLLRQILFRLLGQSERAKIYQELRATI